MHTEDRDDRDFDVLEDDQNPSDAPSTDKDDDFDYLKEIEAIEAQERELEEQRQKKKAELDKLRAEHAKEEHKRSVQRKREMKERKKEAEWLGEPFDDDVETVPVQKKKSKKGIAAIVIIILIAIGAGSGYAYKMQMDKKTVADFEQKVASFQSEKLDGRDFGTHQSYFTDFMKECQDAIDAGDLKQITELNKQWSEVENTYTTVANGKTSLDAFVSGMDQALSTYFITDTYKKNYETLKKDAEKAQKDCDYEKVSDFQKQLDALATNLKADNMKEIQNLKNDISSTDLDKDYVSGITFSGGDPLHPSNISAVTALAKKIRENYPTKTIWLYTGSSWEEICHEKIVQYLDVCVDGEFQIDKRDTSLRWKGSSNQRVIDVPSTLREGKVVLHCTN